MLSPLSNFVKRSYAWITDPYVKGSKLDRLFGVSASAATSGESVTRRTMWSVPSLVQGIDLIASKVAQQKIHVYRREPDNSRVRYVEHPAEKLITIKPSGLLHTPAQFFYVLVSNAIYAGNGYARIKKVGGRIQSLSILDPDCVIPVIDYVKDGTGNTLSYVYYAPGIGGSGEVISDYEMIHLRGKGWESNGYVGTSLVDRCKESIGVGIASIKMAARYYSQDGGLGQIVVECPAGDSFGAKNAVDQMKQIVDTVKQAYAENGIVVMPNGRKLVRNGFTAEETQFLQSREATRIDMACLLGLPANKLNGNIGTSYSSLEMNERAVLSDCYSWWLTKLEQECSMKLLTTDEHESGEVYIEAGRDNLLVLTENEQITVDRERLNNGMMSERQYAEKYNLPFDRDLKDGWRIGNWKYQTLLPGEEPPAPKPIITGPMSNDPTEEEPVEDDAAQETEEELQETS